MINDIRIKATIRNASDNDVKALLAISEMANPELHVPLRKLNSIYTYEHIKTYKYNLIGPVWAYLEYAIETAENYIIEYEDAIKLQPDKQENLFQQYRDHHVNKINKYKQYSYLYNEYFKGEWTIDSLSALADELWRIAYKYDEKLIEAFWLLQRVYSHFLTVGELNARREDTIILYSSPLQAPKKMDSVSDKEYFLPASFKAPRYGRTAEEVENKLHGPSYKIDINGLECTIYTDRLNCFLRTHRIKVADIKADYEEVEIDGTSYQESYRKGYQDGLVEFDKKYNFEKIGSILGIDKYIETLQAIKFNDCKGSLWSPGLEGIKHSHIGTFSHEIIREHGRFSGMYSQIESLMNDYAPIKKAISDHPSYYLSDSPSLTSPVSNSENNDFNSMPLDEVKKWFIRLAENESRNGEPFLTAGQVEQFINRGFAGESFTEKLSINAKSGDKGKVIGLFYAYYTHCITHRPKSGKIDPKATTDKYKRLLTDHFDNWSFDEVKNNFRSGGDWSKPKK